jgi:hypothetical protein
MCAMYDDFDGNEEDDDEPRWSDLLPRGVLVAAFAALLIQLFG